MIPNADTAKYHPDTTAAPTIVRVWTIPADAQTCEQTAVLFSDGTRVTTSTSGRVKVGRDWHTIDRPKVRNSGPARDWPRAGSPASGFATMYFTPRPDAPAA